MNPAGSPVPVPRPAADPALPSTPVPSPSGSGAPVPGSGPGADLRALRDRAVLATSVSFTISDARQPDDPLVWINPAFSRLTGYAPADAVGRNCRFLQGPDTDPAVVASIRAAIADRRSLTCTLLNYRRDGTTFWNQISMSPVLDPDGVLTHFVGVQTDVTDRVEAERARERASRAERTASGRAETARERLALLAEASTLLGGTLDIEVALQQLAHLVVPGLADWCAIDLVDPDRQVRSAAVSSADPGHREHVRLVERLRPAERRAETAVSRVLAGGPPMLLPHIGDADLVAATDNQQLREAYRQLGCRSAVVVPLAARGHVVGALTLVCGASGRTYDGNDLELAADLGRRAAQTVDNARLYTRAHAVAEALQRSLLPSLPTIDGLELAARYLPAGGQSGVGGDWYDVLALPDGQVGVAIGDVMGHDLAAAAAMGQLRSVLRGYAWDGDPAGVVLARLDRLVQGLDMAQLATAVYARLTGVGGGGPVTMRYANAGHLPPLLRLPDGSVRLLDAGRSPLIGVPVPTQRAEATVTLPVGSTLLLCTDGLVEHRDLPVDAGLDRLVTVVRGTPPDIAPEALLDEVGAAMARPPLDDDVAILAVGVR